MRQCRQTLGHAGFTQIQLDMVLPAPCTHHALLKTVGQPLLGSDPAGGCAQAVVIGTPGPQRQHARLFGTQAGTLAGGQRFKYAFVSGRGGIHHASAGRVGGTGRNIEFLVHDAQIAVVVDNHLRAGDFREDLPPETDIGFQPGRPRQGFIGERRQATAKGQQQNQNNCSYRTHRQQNHPIHKMSDRRGAEFLPSALHNQPIAKTTPRC